MPLTDRGRWLNVWMVIFTILTTTSLAGRFWACRIQQRKLRGDDFLIIVSFASLLALQISTWITLPRNLGAHYTELSPEQAAFQHKIQYSSGITWTVATVTCKMAVLVMYLHIFTPSGRARIAIWIAIGCSAAYAVAFIPIFLTACNPPSAAWALDPMVAAAHCHPIQRQEFASVSVNMALDLAVVLIPLPIVWNLQMPRMRKVQVTFLFSLGLAVVGISAWRIVTTVESTQTLDWSYILLTIALQSHLECWLGILAANLPVMTPIFTRILGPAVSSIVRSLVSGLGSGAHSQSRDTNRHSGTAPLAVRVRREFSQLSDRRSSTDIPMMTRDKMTNWREQEVNQEIDIQGSAQEQGSHTTAGLSQPWKRNGEDPKPF